MGMLTPEEGYNASYVRPRIVQPAPTSPRTALLAQSREDAHQAVKAFDRKPDHANTKAAMDALSLYLGLLSQGFDRAPKTREEQAAFATGWDAKVDAPKSCPTRMMDGRNEIRCWLPEGHEGDCK